jgi:hypothetical protein
MREKPSIEKSLEIYQPGIGREIDKSDRGPREVVAN